MRRDKSAAILEVGRVERVAPSGAGLVRGDHGVAFVPLTVPGDLVAYERRAPNKPQARLVAVREPGPTRVTPECPAFGRCGGCDFMHLTRDAQLAAHTEIVRELLASPRAEIETVRIDPAFAYRTRVRLHARASKKRVELGYFAGGSHDIVDRDACAVADPRLFAATGLVRAWLAGSEGECEIALALQTTAADATKPVAAITYRGDPAPALFGEVASACARGDFAGVAIQLEGATAPMITGDPRPAQLARDGKPLWLAPFGFAQSSDHGARELSRIVRELADPAGAHVVELYAGSGTLSVEIARDAASFAAIEEDARAVLQGRENFAARSLAGKWSHGPAERANVSPRTDVVVLDPPRRGAAATIAGIVKARPRRIVYVSCDATTLARDARELATAGYTLTRAVVVELFPQTTHVETVALFVPASRA